MHGAALYCTRSPDGPPGRIMIRTIIGYTAVAVGTAERRSTDYVGSWPEDPNAGVCVRNVSNLSGVGVSQLATLRRSRRRRAG